MAIGIVDPSDFIKWSPIERKFLVFAIDGTTIIGRSRLKESAIIQFNSYLAQRNALVNKGLANRDRTSGGVTIGDTLTPEQKEQINKREHSRRKAGLLDEAGKNEESNVTQIFKSGKGKDS